MKKLFFLVIALSLIGLYSCDRMDNATGPDASFADSNEDLVLALQEIPTGELTDSLETFLTYMREEEKLARDVYIYSFEKWDYFVFDRISRSEQRHMDAVKILLDRYGIEDPVGDNENGVFVNPDLQSLYNTLIEASSDSLTGALLVGAEIEEIDILDILNTLPSYTEEDVQLVMNHLLKGSYMHLGAYVRALAVNGIEYTPKHLTQEQFEAILAEAETHGQGGHGGNGHGNMGGGNGHGHGNGHHGGGPHGGGQGGNH